MVRVEEVVINWKDRVEEVVIKLKSLGGEIRDYLLIDLIRVV